MQLDASSLQRASATGLQLYDFAEGFGSVYGRYVRKRLCQRLISQYGIRSVLEVPCNAESYFASPGTQSVVFAQAGCVVTLVHPDGVTVDKTRAMWGALGRPETQVIQHSDLYNLPLDDDIFDLVWNFDYIPVLANPARAMAEMARVSRAYVLVIVPNRWNIGYPVHALINFLGRRRSPWGMYRWMAFAPVRRALRSAGLVIAESGLVDIPPWPGFDVLNPLGKFLRRHTVEADKSQRSDEQVERMMSKATLIEYAPLPRAAKMPFSHQLYVLARKVGVT